jgi:hypothetical protein
MKVVCKKDLYDNPYLEFKKNEIYEVYYHDGDTYWIRSHYPTSMSFKSTVSMSFISIYKSPPTVRYGKYYIFEEYFYTLEECRKIKLSKINKL